MLVQLEVVSLTIALTIFRPANCAGAISASSKSMKTNSTMLSSVTSCMKRMADDVLLRSVLPNLCSATQEGTVTPRLRIGVRGALPFYSFFILFISKMCSFLFFRFFRLCFSHFPFFIFSVISVFFSFFIFPFFTFLHFLIFSFCFHFSVFTFFQFFIFSFFSFFMFPSLWHPRGLPGASLTHRFSNKNFNFKARFWVREERRKKEERRTRRPKQVGLLPQSHAGNFLLFAWVETPHSDPCSEGSIL